MKPRSLQATKSTYQKILPLNCFHKTPSLPRTTTPSSQPHHRSCRTAVHEGKIKSSRVSMALNQCMLAIRREEGGEGGVSLGSETQNLRVMWLHKHQPSLRPWLLYNSTSRSIVHPSFAVSAPLVTRHVLLRYMLHPRPLQISVRRALGCDPNFVGTPLSKYLATTKAA